jgi:hypothetical protein
MIIIDDFNQNHLNDGLVTITKKDYSIFKPSYIARSSNICNNPDTSANDLSITNNPIIQNFNNNNTQSNMTQNQIYSNTQLLNANQTNTFRNISHDETRLMMRLMQTLIERPFINNDNIAGNDEHRQIAIDNLIRILGK